MVVTEQMQQSMDQQPVDLLPDRVTSHRRLALRARNRYHDVSQQVFCEPRRNAFPIGKGQDIRSSVLAAIASIQGTHGGVADEQDADFGALQTGGHKQFFKPGSYG